MSLPFAGLHPTHAQLRGWLVPAALPLFVSDVHRLQADTPAALHTPAISGRDISAAVRK